MGGCCIVWSVDKPAHPRSMFCLAQRECHTHPGWMRSGSTGDRHQRLCEHENSGVVTPYRIVICSPLRRVLP